jgi:sugar phosphate isomerase/epimerase
MTSNTLPVIGAAIRVHDLPELAAWLIADQRDLEIQDPVWPEILDGDWRGVVGAAREHLDGYQGRLGIHGPFLDLTVMARDPKLRAVIQARLAQGIEFGHALGATHMVVHSPFDFFGHPDRVHSGHESRWPAQLEAIHATLAPIVEQAGQAGITLVMETIYDRRSGPLLETIGSFPRAAMRMSLDTGHAFINAQNGGLAPEAWVRAAGPRLAHVHLQDTDGMLDRHWPPGDGRVDWDALFAALGELEQKPRLLMELRRREDIRRGAGWLADQGLAR